jgi:hypothetical protein
MIMITVMGHKFKWGLPEGNQWEGGRGKERIPRVRKSKAWYIYTCGESVMKTTKLHLRKGWDRNVRERMSMKLHGTHVWNYHKEIPLYY